MTSRILLSMLLGFTLMATACGTDEEASTTPNTDTAQDAIEEEGCEHHQEGPYQTVQAQTLATGTLENIAVEHTSVTVTLADMGDNKGGFVSLVWAEDAEVRLMLTQDVPLTLTDIDGNEVPPEERIEGAMACDEIAVQYIFDLEVGTYTVGFGPTDLTEVALVTEENGAHEGEDHDHEDEDHDDHGDEDHDDEDHDDEDHDDHGDEDHDEDEDHDQEG